MFDTTPTESTALTAQADDGRVLVAPTRFPEGFLENSDSPRVLSETPTSCWLGVELEIATEDLGAMDDAGLVDAVVGFDRMVSWAAARQSALLAEFARRRPADSAEAAHADTTCEAGPYAADEIGLALRLSRGTAAVRLAQARRLDGEMVETRRAWQAGLIDATKVRAVLDATVNLPAERAAAVQDKVLVRASEQTAGQVRAAVARAVVSVDPAGAAERHRDARRDRRVAVNPDQDGMASLWALLPAPDAVSAFEWLTRLARGMGAEDPRGMDARRADLLSALLTGRLTVAASEGGEQVPMPEPVNPGKPLVQVVIPFDTLNGTAEYPGELVGYGPIPAPLGPRDCCGRGVEAPGHRSAIRSVARLRSYHVSAAGGVGGLRSGSGCGVSTSVLPAAGHRLRTRSHHRLCR